MIRRASMGFALLSAQRILGVLPVAILAACDRAGPALDAEKSDPPGERTGEASNGPELSSAPLFVDATAASGLASFRLETGARGERWVIETMAGGLGFLDFEGDGDLDLWVANAHEAPQSGASPGEARDRLFANDGRGTFAEVTERSGVSETGYSFGVAAGDFDNDGRTDVLVTNYGTNSLWRSLGDGTFVEVAESAGLVETGWSTSAVWFDMDRDGDLDLYVARYLDYEPNKSRSCVEGGERVYCHPRFFRGEPDLLYENLGDGRFREIGESAGIAKAGPSEGKGLGVVAADFDRDGLIDLYVANDATPNFLWKNAGGRKFRDVAFELGVAVDENGRAQAGMGVDVADVNTDGLLDIAVTNFGGEYNNLFLGQANGTFADIARRRGLAPSREMLGFGTVLADFDLDGEVDQIVANGHVDDLVETSSRAGGRYRQEPAYFRGTGLGRFELASERAGVAFRDRFVGRGLATADIDDDGDLDVVISTLDRGLVLLRNDTPFSRRRLTLALRGTQSARDAYNARVLVEIAGSTRVYEVQAGRSYLSSSDPRLFIALGDHPRADRVTVRWPRGLESIERDLDAGKHTLVEPE